MEINARINLLIEKLGFNKSSFALKIGVSQPIITHITTGRNNPGLEVIQKILTNCPEVNADWLILGEGEMLLNNKLNKLMINSLLSDIKISISEVENQLNVLKEKVELLEKMNS